MNKDELKNYRPEEDISRWERWMKGEYFFWDAVTSGEDSYIITKKRKFFANRKK